MYFTKMSGALYADFTNEALLKMVHKVRWQVRMYTRENTPLTIREFATRAEAEKYLEELAEKLND